MANEELTPGLWIERTYATYGELEMVENMVERNKRGELMDRVNFKP